MRLQQADTLSADDDQISIGSLFSDESSFHGDNITKEQYEAQVAAYDPTRYWKIQQWDVQRIAAQASNQSAQGRKRKRDDIPPVIGQVTRNDIETSHRHSPPHLEPPSSSMATTRPFNPYEGCKEAKQLEESLNDFLCRLPPSITTTSTGPWIWVANPWSDRRPANEDIARFTHLGRNLLHDFLTLKSEVEYQNPNQTAPYITGMLRKDRTELEHDIDTLAKHYNVVSGKWMLFPSPDHVDQIWATVAKHTVEGDLGCSAKVSTLDPDKTHSHRLICIYSYDYSDLEDVERVLKNMRHLGLVDHGTANSKSRPIYYKCDAYTCLEINSGNEFGLKASMYSSREVFVRMKKEGTFS